MKKALKKFNKRSASILIICLAGLLLLPINKVLATPTGQKYAGSAADSGSSWTNPSNATEDTTGTAATISLTGNGTVSSTLRLTNFRFTASDIPSGSTINGVTVEVEWNGSSTIMIDNLVQLTTDGTNGVGNNNALSTSQTTKQFRTYGGSSDDWGAGLTQAQVTSNTFGVLLNYQKNSGGAAQGVSVYRVRITFEYTAPAGSPTYTQNDFEWFVTANSVTLANVWPAGNGDNLNENAVFTQLPATNEALKPGDRIRLQMNLTIGNATLSAGSQAFRLQYAAAEDCTTATGWTDVGGKGSATIWRLFDETGIGDSTVQVNDISTSNASAEGYYSEINPTANNPNGASIGQNTEWDWPLENNGAADNTTYCFRMAKSDSTPLDNYNADGYPKLTTAPGTASLMRHGNFYRGDIERGYFWAN